MEFLGILCLILITTTLAGFFCKKIGVPAVIGQLLVGIVIGPAMLNIVHQDVFIHDFSEIGVIMLMFIAGMECELDLLKKYAKPSVMVAILGILLPVGFTMLTTHFFNFSWKESFFLGLVLAATSVSISVEVLRELNVLSSREGATILGASVVDDIAVVIILSVAVGMIGSTGTGNASQFDFVIKLIEQVLYFIGIFFVVRWIAPYLLRLSEKMMIGSAVIIMSLVICLGMAYIADLVGLSSVVGAFFAGIAVGQTKAKPKIDFNIEAIGYAVFIPVFFASIGLSITFDTLGKDLPFICIMTVMALLTKLFGGALGAKSVGFSNTSALVVGAGMISRGEMALIIAQIGFQSKLLSEENYTSMIVVIILTTLAAPFLLKHYVKKLDQSIK
jgi:monovalent cation:proton antiporter-2 (CPA2) family protein